MKSSLIRYRHKASVQSVG